MPYLNVNDTDLWYEDSGSGAETIVFSHGFLMDHTMFDAQVRSLEDSYRCVRFDHRGQGRSEVTETGYEIDALTADAAALIRKLDLAPCHFAGLSMGGFVGLRLAIRHPELLRSLILLNTAADPEPRSSRLKYTLMAGIARWFGFRPLVRHITRIMFGKTFLDDPAMQTPRAEWQWSVLSANRAGILKAVDGVLGRPGVLERLPEIRMPTLVIVGEEDTVTPPRQARKIEAGVASATMVVIPGAGHSSTIEQPDRVTAAILDFLVGQRSGPGPVDTR